MSGVIGIPTLSIGGCVIPQATPKSIFGTSRLVFWVNGSDVQTSGGEITRANDQSGNVVHLTPPAAGNRPSAAQDANGVDVIRCDGSSDYLDASGVLASPASQPVSVFAVVRDATGGAGDRTILDAGNAYTATRVVIYRPYSLVVYAGGGLFIPAQDLGTTTKLIEVCFSGASSTAEVGSGGQVSGSTGSNALTHVRIGANASAQAATMWNGDFYEVFAVTGTVTATERAQARAYIKARNRISF